MIPLQVRDPAQSPMDVLVVGCGLRAAGLLTATPALFDYDLGIVDGSDRLAVGSFDRYDIQSNSSGSDFFGWIDPDGPCGSLLAEEPVHTLRATPGAFHLATLARALESTGRLISQLVQPDRLFLGDQVTRIELSSDAPPQVLTSSGRRLSARTIVLATGIRERITPELSRWAGKSVAARELIAPEARLRCLDLAQRPGIVCFAGASHSALSVLQRMLEQPPGADTEIVLVTRSPVRLHYSSWQDYCQTSHTDAEAVPDPARDICPETGNVHRYSGLRHGSKRLFRSVAAGQIRGVRLAVAGSATARNRHYAAADVLITAIGYQSNLPPVLWDGASLRCTDAGGLVELDAQGRLRAVPRAGQVFVIGLDPYPYQDNSINPTNQYKKRGSHILDHLAQRQAPRQPAQVCGD